MFSSEYNVKFMFNPLFRLISQKSDNFTGINELKREAPIIVSLSSDEDNFDDLEISIYSLLNQTVKPDRLILWLSDEYDLSYLPYNITRFIKSGLEIKFVKDIGEYTSTIYPLQQFHKAINVVANDCVFYPKDWLLKLYHSYIANPRDIHTHIAHKAIINNNKILKPYADWKKHINQEDADYNNFAKSKGGTLYPPACFSKEVFRNDIFVKNHITDSDIWMWFMGLIAGRKVRIVKNHINSITYTKFLKHLFEYKNKKYTKTDKQINTLMKYYKQNILSKLNS